MSEKKGFFATLLDFSFTEFVTPKIIKFLFVLSIFCSALAVLLIIIGGFASGSVIAGILALIFSPLIFFLYVLFARMWLELIVVAFRIAENTGRLVEQNKSE